MALKVFTYLFLDHIILVDRLTKHKWSVLQQYVKQVNVGKIGHKKSLIITIYGYYMII